MKIKMLTLMAGPQGIRKAGSVHVVADEEAKALIAGGYAVKAADAEAPEAPKGAKPERSTRKGEKAVKPEAAD